MNIYKFTHVAKCPNGELVDCYEIEVCSAHTIMVEQILQTIKEIPSTLYQEELATLLRNKIGACVTVSGWHHGIKIVSIRP